MQAEQGAGWRIVRVLGAGAFGTVYLAESIGKELQRQVAIKLLHAERAASPQLVGRLRDEARMMSLLRHRAIARVDDLIQLEGSWAIVMEYVEGADLEAMLAVHGRLPPSVAAHVCEEVASALAVAAAAKGPGGEPLELVHRDVKPANIRVTETGEVKLLDFGIARAKFEGREAKTGRAGFGTPIYMAAERHDGKDTHAGDVYALGITLFELLTGRPPGRMAGDLDRRPPGKKQAADWEYVAGLHPELLALVTEMIEEDEPERRPDARTVARRLSQLRGNLGDVLLDEWAASAVPAAASRPAQVGGEHTLPPGHVFSNVPRPGSDTMSLGAPPEATITVATVIPVDPPQTGRGLLVAGMSAVVGLGGVAGIALIAVLAGWWARPESPSSVPLLAPPAEPALPTPETPPAATTAPEPPPAEARPVAQPAPARRASRPAPTFSPERASAGRTDSETAAPVPVVTPLPTGPGTLVVRGNVASVKLNGASASYGPGEVPEGSYTAVISLEDGTSVAVRGVRILPGRTTVITCEGGGCRVGT